MGRGIWVSRDGMGGTWRRPSSIGSPSTPGKRILIGVTASLASCAWSPIPGSLPVSGEMDKN